MDSITEMTAQYFDNYIVSTASAVVIDASVNARNAATHEVQTEAAQYSAILDDDICSLCESLDGMIVDLRSDEGLSLFNRYSPAQHESCRCMWIHLLEGDPDIPNNTETANKDFDKKVVERFNQINQGENMTLPEIINSHALHNFKSSPQYWEDIVGEMNNLQDQRTEKREEQVSSFFGNYISEIMSGGYVGEVDDNGFPI